MTVQAGGSSDGRDLAAAQAEAVFTRPDPLTMAFPMRAISRARAVAMGVPADSIVILPELATVIGSTEAEAKRRQDELWDLVPIDYSLARLAGTLQIAPNSSRLDKPLPDPLPLLTNANHTMFHGTVAIARRDNLTVRQLLERTRRRCRPSDSRRYAGSYRAMTSRHGSARVRPMASV